jgi:hypothetical protein
MKEVGDRTCCPRMSAFRWSRLALNSRIQIIFSMSDEARVAEI